jgi:hypothetical protein
MTHEADLREIERRAQRYWDVDGLPELVMGFLWVCWGGAWLIGDSLPRDWRGNAYWLFVPAALMLSGVGAVAVVKRRKARRTFPRTGWVEWSEPSRRTRLAAAAVALVTAAVLVRVANAESAAPRNVAPILGVILSLAFLVASVRQRAPHHLALAAVALTLGVALGGLGEGWSSANRLFVWVGAASALVGGVRLAVFLRRHPRARLGET